MIWWSNWCERSPATSLFLASWCGLAASWIAAGGPLW